MHKMPKKNAKKKTPLPDAILKDKEFIRQLDILIDCSSPDPEKARRAQDAALAIVADDPIPKMFSHLEVKPAEFKKVEAHGADNLLEAFPVAAAQSKLAKLYRSMHLTKKRAEETAGVTA